jgi:GNAT superfamily N-acetyltransferase
MKVTSDGAKRGAPVVLPDGARILLRPICSDDKRLLVDAFEHLSPESRYRRFLAPHVELTEPELRYFTEIDHVRHEAIVALDTATGEVIGVARCIALSETPDTAEMAVAVVDEWQGRGVGTALLHALVGRARANGVRRFAATVLSANTHMIELLRELGDVRIVHREGGVSEFSVELPERGLGSLADLLRHAAVHR